MKEMIRLKEEKLRKKLMKKEKKEKKKIKKEKKKSRDKKPKKLSVDDDLSLDLDTEPPAKVRKFVARVC